MKLAKIFWLEIGLAIGPWRFGEREQLCFYRLLAVQARITVSSRSPGGPG